MTGLQPERAHEEWRLGSRQLQPRGTSGLEDVVSSPCAVVAPGSVLVPGEIGMQLTVVRLVYVHQAYNAKEEAGSLVRRTEVGGLVGCAEVGGLAG
ncbi:MAG: hypothetical protein BGO38_14805 [Cellulomonas sp. 73-145]|nr:MAG: hypothetical protein BGO38_14805 [Cellulomonas sp. 73-145]